MQYTSCKMPGCMKYKLESSLLGEISITSDIQMSTKECTIILKYQCIFNRRNSLLKAWCWIKIIVTDNFQARKYYLMSLHHIDSRLCNLWRLKWTLSHVYSQNKNQLFSKWTIEHKIFQINVIFTQFVKVPDNIGKDSWSL